MADPRSDRLIGPVLLADTPTLVMGPVPAGQRWLLKSVRGVETLGDSLWVDVTLGPFDRSRALFWHTAVGGLGILSDTTWEAFHEGDELWARAQAADAVVLWGSGARLGQ